MIKKIIDFLPRNGSFSIWKEHGARAARKPRFHRRIFATKFSLRQALSGQLLSSQLLSTNKRGGLEPQANHRYSYPER